MVWRGAIFGSAAVRERIARASTPLLLIRVLEGVAAWVFFNEFFLPSSSANWAIQAAFVAYLILNPLVVLRYRRGRIPRRLVLADIATTVCPLALPVAASGGLSSPLLLLFAVKATHFAIVFGSSVAALFVGGLALMLACSVASDQLGLMSVIPPGALSPVAAQRMWQTAILGVVAGGSATTIWLRHVWADAQSRVRGTAERADREGASAAVAAALLNVSDAVSRLTRIDEILERVVEIAPRSMEADHCGIALWQEDTGRYTAAVAVGAGPTIDRRFTGLELPPEEVPDFEWVRRLGHCAVVPASESPHVSAPDVAAVLIAPLISGEKFYGVIEFARRGARRAFTQRDLTIADGVARQTAVALERARLTEEGRSLVRAVESTEEAVVIHDARGGIVFVNPAFLRTFGYRAEEVLGRDGMELVGGVQPWVEQLREQVQRRSWRGEVQGFHKDGTPIPIMLNASLMRDEDGRVQGEVAILQDVSAEKTFQEQMQRADRLAAVGETASGIAHEINNALAVIFGQTGDLAEHDDLELRARLTRVDAQARRIADIVQGVLGFARPRPPRQEPIDLAAVASSTLDLVRHDLERHRIRLETGFDPDLPPALADPRQVQQVLLNLCRNAIQAMANVENGWLRVEVLGIDDRLAVRVTDGGPGMSPEVLGRVFDPFFSTKAEGSGLGLSVSYALARAHGGDLLVTSEPGRGATFTLLLPIAEPGVVERMERILLVDDDPEVAEALTEMLTKEGLQVSRAATGEEALRLLGTDAWDAVFLDVRLPDLSGPEVYEEIRTRQPDLAQRVVFVTGGLWRAESRLRRDLPPQPILAKPCTQDQVRDVLRRLRSQRRQAA